ncbi:hypothetical protein U9M48_014490 [Paspalum notatum var. saurae]|uniref:Uncharacterized protein n=1 Tax=Paspalum notatum var. saurae TaxID=547442 RepID=A0AAQ3T1N3_PASNO
MGGANIAPSTQGGFTGPALRSTSTTVVLRLQQMLLLGVGGLLLDVDPLQCYTGPEVLSMPSRSTLDAQYAQHSGGFSSSGGGGGRSDDERNRF